MQIRNPFVEKLHREEINTSTEQLKSFLGPEFLKQHPDSKLEKVAPVSPNQHHQRQECLQKWPLETMVDTYRVEPITDRLWILTYILACAYFY